LTPPLAASTATRPAGTAAAPGTKLADSPAAGTRNPLVFGPSSRMPVPAVIAVSSRCSAAPSPPASAKPPPQITAARAPAAAASASTPGQAAAGTQITARSTGPSAAAAATEPYIVSSLPLTRATLRDPVANRPSDLAMTAPSLPGLRDAPTTAILRGANSAAMPAVAG
jgi:hypothetical protein